MDTGLAQLLVFGIVAALANVLGGLILFPVGVQKIYKKSLKYVLALGAGFMLAVSFVDVLPEVVELWLKKDGFGFERKFDFPMILLLGGYLLTQFFEHTVAPHFHLGEEVQADHLISTRSAYTAIGGLLIHTFFDGVSISAAAQVDYKVGILVLSLSFSTSFPKVLPSLRWF
jgi:zinc transporter ZupT